jgi:hypothetical protein
LYLPDRVRSSFVWLFFGGCASTKAFYNYLSLETYVTLGEEELRKTQFFLSADIELTRIVSTDAQSEVASGSATITKDIREETIEISVNTPGELIDVFPVKLNDGREVQVLGVCFDEDTSKVLYFMHGTLPSVSLRRSGAYGEWVDLKSRTGYYLLADDYKPATSGQYSTGKIEYGDIYYNIKAYRKIPDLEVALANGLIGGESIPINIDGFDTWPFLRANLEINTAKTVTTSKATGRVVQ